MQHSTAITPASFRFTYQGTWSANKIYNQNDVVRFRGRTWYCKVVNSQQYFGYGYRPDKDTEMWAMNMHHHVIRGGWSPHFTYHLGDVVSYEGDWYMCQVNDALEGSHPIYKNGTTTTEWRKMTASARKSPRLYVPHWAGWNPMGWTKYGPVNNCGSQANYQNGQRGMRLLNHCGDLIHIGRGTDYTGRGQIGALGFNSRKATISNIQRVNNNSVNHLWGHTKSGLYNEHGRIVQWGGSDNANFFLTDDGQVYGLGANTDSVNGLGLTKTRRLFGGQGLGKDDQTGGWLASATALTGTMADRFVVKLAFGASQDAAGGCMMALDSDGDVWVWGEGSQGLGLGNKDDVTVPTKISSDLFGGADIVDIYAMANATQLGAAVFWLIDANGVLWQIGADNNYHTNSFDNTAIMKTPFAVGDWSRYGGIKHFYPTTAKYGGNLVLANDGSVHYAGRIDYMWGNRDIDAVTRRHGEYFLPLTEYYHAAMKASNGRNSAVGSGADIFENVEKAFPYNRYSYGAFLLKHKETGELYTFGYGGHGVGNIDEKRVGAGSDNSATRYTHTNSTAFTMPMRFDGVTAGPAMEEDIVHMGLVDRNDAGGLGDVSNALYLYSNGRIKAVGSTAQFAGFASGDILAADVGFVSNFRAGEFMAGWDDSAGQAMEVRGGTNSQNNIMAMGLVSETSSIADNTVYYSMIRMEQNGRIWVSGHAVHRTLESASIYQQSLPSAENEDASLFGWFCVS